MSTGFGDFLFFFNHIKAGSRKARVLPEPVLRQRSTPPMQGNRSWATWGNKARSVELIQIDASLVVSQI